MNFEIAEKQIPAGWYGLLKDVFEKKPEDLELVSIREINGQLIIQADREHRFEDYLEYVFRKSKITCMGCGMHGEFRVYKGRVWVLCFKCYKNILIDDQPNSDDYL